MKIHQITICQINVIPNSQFVKLMIFQKTGLFYRICRLSFLSQLRDNSSPYIVSYIRENHSPKENYPSHQSM